MIELLRTLPMSVSGAARRLVRVRAAQGGAWRPVAIRDIRQGPRSGGTGFVLLHHLVGAPAGSVRGRGWWRDGPEAFTDARRAAARAARRRRSAPDARGRAHRVRDDAVAGVVLAEGEEIAAPRGDLHRGSRAHAARAGGSGLARSRVPARRAEHPVPRLHGVVLYALDALPDFPGSTRRGARGHRLAHAAARRRSSARPTPPSTAPSPRAPHVELTCPTLRWPALAPAGKHVLVARAQYAPYRLRDGALGRGAARGAGDGVTARSQRRCPGFAAACRIAWRGRPPISRQRFGLREGAVTHGELGLDQILFMRPVAGWGRHATPIARPLSRRRGDPSRARGARRPGLARGAARCWIDANR